MSYNPWVGISVTDSKAVAEMIKKLPKPIADAVSDSIAEYMIKVYRNYPPYKYVSRKRAFGKTFESEKQRRYFFWALKNGIIRIGNHRTHRLSRGWKQQGSGQKSIIINEVPYSPFVQGDEFIQSRMMGLIGWEQFDEAYENRFAKPGLGTAAKVIYGAVRKAIRSVGLKTD